MNKAPLISIIIPAYNAESFLEPTLSSALNQTYPQVEVIVVDDGSTDKTSELVKKHKAQHQNLRYIFEDNQGQSAARKNGLLSSKGEWVTFLDADNLLIPSACEAFASHLPNGCDIYYGDISYFDDANPKKMFKFSLHSSQEATLENLIDHNFINFLGTFIKKEKLLDCFDSSFRRADDHIIWLKLVLKDAKFFYVNQILGQLRFHQKNLSFQDSYLVETAITNLELFDWLEKEIRKKYVGDRLAVLLGKIKEQIGVWVVKGYLGAIIVKNKRNARWWLKKKYELDSRRISYRLLSSFTFVAPLSLFAPVLRYARRKFVMKKYSQI